MDIAQYRERVNAAKAKLADLIAERDQLFDRDRGKAGQMWSAAMHYKDADEAMFALDFGRDDEMWSPDEWEWNLLGPATDYAHQSWPTRVPIGHRTTVEAILGRVHRPIVEAIRTAERELVTATKKLDEARRNPVRHLLADAVHPLVVQERDLRAAGGTAKHYWQVKAQLASADAVTPAAALLLALTAAEELETWDSDETVRQAARRIARTCAQRSRGHWNNPAAPELIPDGYWRDIDAAITGRPRVNVPTRRDVAGWYLANRDHINDRLNDMGVTRTHLTVGEAADAAGIQPRTFSGYVARKQAPAADTTGRWYTETIDAWLLTRS